MSQRVTIIFTTIDRPICAQRFVASVRARYPDIAMIVADQNQRDEQTDKFYSDMKVKAIYTDDVGVAAARNRAVEAVETEFVWLCDDDFILMPATDLAIPLEILDAEPSVQVVGGIVFNVSSYDELASSRVHDWQRYFYLDRARRAFLTVDIDRTFYAAHRLDDLLYFDSDVVLNWAVFRRAVFDNGQRWDERFTCNGEHEDFFLSLKFDHNARVVYAPQFVCAHHSPVDPAYGERRNAREGWAEFGKKWGVEQYWDCLPLTYRLEAAADERGARNLLQRIREELPATARTAIIARIDDSGTIDLSELREDLETRLPKPPGSHSPSAGKAGTVEPPLPPLVLRALAKAWKRRGKRMYLKIVLRLAGIRIRDRD